MHHTGYVNDCMVKQSFIVKKIGQGTCTDIVVSQIRMADVYTDGLRLN